MNLNFPFSRVKIRSEVAGSHDKNMFKFLINCQIVNKSDHANLHSHQQCMRVTDSILVN